MRQSFIKDYRNWLLESTYYLREATNPNSSLEELLAAVDLESLYQRIQTSDSEEIKGLPNYAAVTAWWERGGPDLNTWKTLVKSGKARTADKKNSAKSMYYWLGGYSKGRSTASRTNFVENIKAYCVAIKTYAPSIVAAVNSFTDPKQKSKYLGWSEASAKADIVLSFIETLLRNKLNLTQAGAQLLMPWQEYDGTVEFKQNQKVSPDAYFKSIADIFANTKSDVGEIKPAAAQRVSVWGLYNTPNGTTQQQLTANIGTLNAAKADGSKASTYFEANNTLASTDKTAILEYIDEKVQNYINTKNKNLKSGATALTADDAIKIATDLYITPQGTKIEIPPAMAQPSQTPQVIRGSYPEDPKGDWNSEGAKKATQFFEDDAIEIKDPAIKQMTDGIKSYVDKLKEMGAEITGVTIFGIASTSQVPSTYDQAKKGPNSASQSTQENNEPLAKDRLTSIKTALRTIFTQSGIADDLITEDTTKDQVFPNSGDKWTQADRSKFANRKNDETLLKEYNEKYGKWKYAYARFIITYKMTKEYPVTVTPFVKTVSDWKVYINWVDETIELPRIPNIPGIGIGTGLTDKKPSSGSDCPAFN